MSPFTTWLCPAPAAGTSEAAGCVGQNQSNSCCDSFHRSVADEDFAAACLGLQPRTQSQQGLSPLTRDRWHMVECLLGGTRPARAKRNKSPTSPVETPISMRMRKTIKPLLPRVLSASEVDSEHRDVFNSFDSGALRTAAAATHAATPHTAAAILDMDGLADTFARKIPVRAKGMQHFTDEEERRHEARWSDASDKSAAGTPRSSAGREWGPESSRGASVSVDAAALARDILADEAALFSCSGSKMKTVWPASFVSAPVLKAHIKPSRHVSRLLHASLVQS